MTNVRAILILLGASLVILVSTALVAAAWANLTLLFFDMMR